MCYIHTHTYIIMYISICAYVYIIVYIAIFFPFLFLGNSFLLSFIKVSTKNGNEEKSFCDSLGSHSLLHSDKQLRCTSLKFFRVVPP